MTNFIIIAVVVLIVGLALGYIIRQKKQGAKCIGCAHSKSCGSKNCSCGH